ncbi:MAG: AMP-binding protein [Acidobacteria bacterium]|nr:AMP-binding protein [Acidobacteriota bacterium]
MRRTTLLAYLDDFGKRGSETAYVFRRGYRTERWSYGAVARSARQFARLIEARGVEMGDRILLWGDNCAEWVVAFLGGILRGAVIVPMDRITSPDFAARVCAGVNARLCVCSRELLASFRGAPALVLEDLAALTAPQSDDLYEPPRLTRNSPIQIIFTSGTTAEPKGVVISHGNVLANLEPLESEIGRYLKYERLFHPLRFLNLVPLSHVFGQFMGVFVPQLLGAVVVFHDSLNPSEIVRVVRQERVSVLVGVPRLLDSLKNKIERDIDDAGKGGWFRFQLQAADGEHFLRRWWRFREIHRRFGWKFWALISGGAALDPKTESFWNRLGFLVIQGYGLTETTALVSVNHPLKIGKGSIGKTLPGLEMKLAANGEILVRGESVASGYFDGHELKPVAGEEGWFHTGDVGELDANGNLYFKGRKKDVIVNPEGMNIYPEDLEAALKKQSEVRDCVVLGIEREGNAEPCAVLILRDHACDADAAVRRANESLAQYQHVRRWFIWPEEDFPRTATQKPKMAVIRDFVRSRAGGPAAAQTGGLAELLSRITGRPPGVLSPDTKLAADLDLSSLERVELLSALEDRYQVDLNESRFSAATTVGDLERMLAEPAAARTDYRYPRWAQRWPVALLRFVVYYLLSWPATLVMSYPRIRGRENLRGMHGPLLFVANHVTQVDVGFIMAALPFRFRHRIAVAMLGEMLREMRHPTAGTGLFRKATEKLSYFLVVALFNVFPLPQRTGFRESFIYAGECADRGYSLLVFPEGRRSQDGRLSPFQAGIGLLARNLRLPVVPVRIDGLYELKQRGKRFTRPGTVTVTVGPPMEFPPQADAADIAEVLEERMRAMEEGQQNRTGLTRSPGMQEGG